MDNEQYAFVLGVLARLDRKMDFLLEASREKAPADSAEFEEELDL